MTRTTEYSETSSKKGRGRAKRSLDLIEAMPAEIGHALRRAPDGAAAGLVGAVVDRLTEMGRPPS
jgi:hypothetical protein